MAVWPLLPPPYSTVPTVRFELLPIDSGTRLKITNITHIELLYAALRCLR